jgi:hypothetical protein
MSEKNDYVREVHAYLRSLPPFLDSKIAVLAAAAVGSFLFNLNMLKEITFDASERDLTHFLLIVFLFGGLIACMLSVLAAFASLWARTSGQRSGLTSFLAIHAKRNPSVYLNNLDTLTNDEILKEIANHNFELSSIIFSKIRWANNAIGCLAVGIALTAGSVADITIMKTHSIARGIPIISQSSKQSIRPVAPADQQPSGR